MSQWLHQADDMAFAANFDAGSLARGRAYAEQSRTSVVAMTEDGTGLEIEGFVGGSRGAEYDVSAYVDQVSGGRRSPVDIGGDCSCPVAVDCKHVVALVLTARRMAAFSHLSGQSVTAVEPRPRWQSDLDTLVHALDSEPRSPSRPKRLALQVELPTRLAHSLGPAALQLRPLGEGARSNWVRTGIGWQHLRLAHQAAIYDAEQVEVLMALGSVLGVGHSAESVTLGSSGPGLWSQLDRVSAAGIELVPAGRLTSIEILDERLAMTGDVVQVPGGHQLRIGVTHEGEHRFGVAIGLIGRPGHGVAMTVVDPDAPRRTPASSRLVLARLEPRVPIALERIHHAGGTVTVPGEQAEEFARSYLSRLSAHLPIGSSDGSIDIPDDVVPHLQLRITWGAADRVGLQWMFAYPQDEDEAVTFPIDSRVPGAMRRRVAEQRLLESFDLDETARGVLHDARNVLIPAHELGDVWVLLFVDAVLPRLRELPDLEIIDIGLRPDYREATGDLEIEFDVVEADPEADDERTDWLDLSVAITIEGESIPLPTVLAALTANRPRIILPSGLHVSTDRPEFARLRELVAAAGELHDQDGEGLRVSRHDLGTWGELAELGVVDEQAAQWVEAAKALTGIEGLPQVDPVGLKHELRNYQLDGFRWLVFLWEAGLGGILADDMGLGKTLQTLALVGHAREHGAGPFLVIAPTSVMSAWSTEAATHTPGLDVRLIDSTAARRIGSLGEAVQGADLVVTSYTRFRLEADAYAEIAWGGMILDEAQAIKNHQGKTYQAVRLMDVPFRLAVTGTPFENRLMELWSLLSVVAPGLYPWPRRFRDQVVKPVEKYADQQVLDRFRSRIRPFLLRRTKEVVAADLPDKQEQVLEVTLNPRHRKLYDTHLQRERQTILGLVKDFDKNRVAIFSALTKLRQLSLDAALVDSDHEGVGSAKLDVLVEHISEAVAEGHRVLVFSQFTGFLKRARARLDGEGIESRYLDGSTRDRAGEIAAFKSGASGVFLISLKAGGVGLTLTEADYVFVLDPWWNPAAEAQAVDRAHRIGQVRPVMVYRLVATDTIEEKVMELKEKKAALFASVFSGDGAVGKGISDEDVRSLFD